MDKRQKRECKLSSAYNYVGKIDRVMPNFIIKANNPNCKNNFIDDTSSLPAATKSKIVNFFLNDKTSKGAKRKVVYLVRGDKIVKK